MHKWKQRLLEKFLPFWCREELLKENERLSARVAELKAEVGRLDSYAAGMEDALRLGRRIKIYTGEVRAVGPVECADRQQDL